MAIGIIGIQKDYQNEAIESYGDRILTIYGYDISDKEASIEHFFSVDNAVTPSETKVEIASRILDKQYDSTSAEANIMLVAIGFVLSTIASYTIKMFFKLIPEVDTKDKNIDN